jgi:hypothetical protein
MGSKCVVDLVLMRRPPCRVALVLYTGLTPTELWLGDVTTDLDFDRVVAMATIAADCAEGKN